MSKPPPPPGAPGHEPARRPPPPPGAERRRYERFEVLAQVELSAGGEVHLLPVVNVSAGGMLLAIDGSDALPPPVEAGQRVNVFMELGDNQRDGDMTLELDAEVMRTTRGGPGERPTIALMWTSTNPAAASQLARALEHLREHSPG